MWIPEPLTLSQIEARANELVFGPLRRAVGDSYLLENGIRLEDVLGHVATPLYGITVEEHVDLSRAFAGKPALGLYHVHRNHVEISALLSPLLNDPRRTFTWFHEVCGHGVLQGEYLRRQRRSIGPRSLVDSEQSMALDVSAKLERQANAMAAYCAAPLWLVDRQIMYRLELSKPEIAYLGPGRYYLGRRSESRPYRVESFKELARCIASRIQPWFGGLSVEALSFRVMRSRFVEDRTRGRGCLLRAA